MTAGHEERGERNALANDRTLLASERTLAAWWRTAIALLVLFVGARRYAATARRVENEFVERVPRAEIWVGTGLLVVLAIAAGVIVWTGG